MNSCPCKCVQKDGRPKSWKSHVIQSIRFDLHSPTSIDPSPSFMIHDNALTPSSKYGFREDESPVPLVLRSTSSIAASAQRSSSPVQQEIMHFNDSASQLPPPNNPILESYLKFKKETPFVTRNVLTSQLVFFVLSFLFDPTDAAANIPHFTIHQYQVYRIVLSPFLCNRFISLVFAYFNFTENGRRLERSTGTTAFLILIFTVGTLTNLLYICVALLLNATAGSDSLLFQPASGIWIVLFAVISIECSKAPPQSVRKLIFVPVSTTVYPLALFALFSLLGSSFELSYLISVVVGYAYGHGYLDRIIPGSPRCRRLEEKILRSFVAKEGWIACDNILGSGAWNEGDNNTATSENNSEAGFFSQIQQQYRRVSTNSSHTSQSRPGNGVASATTSSATPFFPTSGGHKLGSASRRPTSTTDARQARLQAIEKRMDAASRGDVV